MMRLCTLAAAVLISGPPCPVLGRRRGHIQGQGDNVFLQVDSRSNATLHQSLYYQSASDYASSLMVAGTLHLKSSDGVSWPGGRSSSISDWRLHNPYVAMMLTTPVFLGFSLLLMATISIFSSRNDKKKREAVRLRGGKTKLEPWSVFAITCLTSYKLYTGFLSSTWMPYLLACEGEALAKENQAVFMGVAKLIYGFSVLLSPLFGLGGDKVSIFSHWSVRRFFVLAGATSGGLGIYGCIVAAKMQSVGWYLVGTVLWMIGEAMADVTSESLIPELLPKSQYDLSSAIRSVLFLIGGLLGYIAIIACRGLPYDWMYYAYLIVSTLCAFLTLTFMQPRGVEIPKKPYEDMSLFQLCVQAYAGPLRLPGGFPMGCLALFVFTLGAAPLFFLYLMVRDLVRIEDQALQQTHFGAISMTFFIMAAIASVLHSGGSKTEEDEEEVDSSNHIEAIVPDERAFTFPDYRRQDFAEAGSDTSTGGFSIEVSGPPTPTGPPTLNMFPRADTDEESVHRRWRNMVISQVVFAVICAIMPTVGLWRTELQRTISFYVISVFFGFSFGVVFTRFQECTWIMLPAHADVANAMGFATMSKMAGLGIGNCLVGFILAAAGGGPPGDVKYAQWGYVVMCSWCCVTVLLSALIAYRIYQSLLQGLREGSA